MKQIILVSRQTSLIILSRKLIEQGEEDALEILKGL